MNINNFDVNKPHDYNMKYSIFKEYEDEDNKNTSKLNTEKVVIGNIDGYQDIIESDKINLNTNKKNNIIKTKQKNEMLHLFEENSLYDFTLDNTNYKRNENLINIENEYDFEDLPTNENESKVNKNKIEPFHASKTLSLKQKKDNEKINQK